MRSIAFSGVKWTTIGTVGRALFQILQISVLTRFLPKEAFGLVAMALFVLNFTNIFVDMGFTSAILHRQNATSKEYNSVFWFNLFLSFILFALVVFMAPFVSSFYNQPELKSILVILGFNLILLSIGRVHRTILQKEFRFKQISIVDIISSIIGLIIASTLAIHDYGVYSLIYSTLSISLISSIALVVLNSKKHSIQFYFDVKELLPFLKVGSYSMGSRLVSFFSTDIDILIIGKTMGPASLGLYSLSKQLILKLYSIINPIITNVLSPLLSSIQDDPKRLKRYYLKVVALISTVNIPIYLIVVVLSSEILAIVYGLEYTEAKNILSSLALVYCINSISNPVGSLQIATGRTDIGLKWAIFSLIVTPVVIYFASKFDINTVAFSRAILSLVMMIPLWFIQLRPMANIGLKEYLSQFYKPLLFFLTATLFVYLMGNKTEITDNIVANVIIKTVTISLTFSGFVIIFDKKAVLETFHLFISTVNVKGTK
jgi:O-antigen/teichoic acid export membrane protein